jgi:O-antigen ligase
MKKIEIIGPVLLGLLFFVWPIPHTVSLRDILLALNLCFFGYLAWCRGWPRRNLRDLSAPAVILAALTAWMYFVAVFVASETAWSLSEIGSQWIRGLAALIAGAWVAVAVRTESDLKQKALLAIFIALLLHVLYVDLEAMNIWLHDQSFERLRGLTEGPDKSNYLTNLLFCFLLAEFFQRIMGKKRVLPFGNGILTTAIAVALVSVSVERMRNGVAVLALLLLVLGAFYLFERRKQLKKPVFLAGVSVLLVITLGGLGLAAMAKENTSLKKLIATIPIAWDTEHYKGWQDEKKYGLPVLPSGETVDPSAYQRIAWLKQGLLMIGEHPFGIGFGRNAFGHGLKAKYGEGGGHSHSGLLDFAIGTGIPGTLLWLGFFVSLMRLAWKRSRATHSHAAILLMLLLLDFGARMVVDSVIRDHMLQQFMFLVGLAAVLTMAEVPEKRKSPA